MDVEPWVYPIGNENVTKNIDYTKKEETAVLDENGDMMWSEMGDMPPNMYRAGEKHAVIINMLKNRTKLEDVLDYDPSAFYHINSLEKVAALYDKPEHRDDLQVRLITGPTGIGKTYAIMRMLEPEIYNKPHAKPGQTDFYMGYNGEPAILMDDFHPSRYPMMDLLNYFQEYKLTVQIKGSHKAARWNRIYISSNLPIEQWYIKEQHDPQYAENYRALLRRIPPQNRLHFHTPIPRGVMINSWEELVATQSGPVPQLALHISETGAIIATQPGSQWSKMGEIERKWMPHFDKYESTEDMEGFDRLAQDLGLSEKQYQNLLKWYGRDE